MSNRCQGCGKSTKASGSYCQTCKSKVHHAHKRIKREGLLVDVVGGSWWVWTAKGKVLVIGKDSKQAAIYALACGEDAESEDEVTA